MFRLEQPYVSEFFVDTIVQNDFPVLNNDTIEESDIEDGAFSLINPSKAIEYYQKQEFPLIYSNSENALDWVLENIPLSNLSSYIKIFKDKFEFRELLKELYPNFYYQSMDLDTLEKTKKTDIKFPVVVKPAVGFLSLGVHTVNEASEWDSVISTIKKEVNFISSEYPKSVVDSSKFLIEELIDGDEYAVDAYYDRNGDPVILNIYQHPLENKKDVRDRIYIMSTEIMVRYMAKIVLLLKKIGDLKNIRNFPMHIELKITNEGEFIPIEVNPMRFAGWCTADVAKYAWKINVYEYFYTQKRPDWNAILSNSGKEIYYFSMAEVPTEYKQKEIKDFDYAGFLANFSNVLEVRKINYSKHSLFAVIFGSTTNENEIKRILALDTKPYITI